MSNVIIRAYLPSDRQAVRSICADENSFPCPECIADLMSAYYTDYELQSVFVAEKQGRVIGYIMGSLDNRRYGLAMLFIIFPKFLVKSFFRGIFFNQQFWHMVVPIFKNGDKLMAWRKESFHSHEGHVRIGVMKDLSQQGIGNQLMDVFLNHAKKQHIEILSGSKFRS